MKILISVVSIYIRRINIIRINMPDRSLSSIKEFLVGSPRNVKAGSRAQNLRTEVDAEQKEF